MGVLHDYFIARDDADAKRAHASATGPQDAGFKSIDLKGIDPIVNLAVLDEIVNGRDALAWIRASAGATVAGGADDEHWVFRVAPEHATMLADLPTDLLPTATRWAQSEELAGSDPGDLADVLASLRELAKEARSSGQRLYCWVSL